MRDALDATNGVVSLRLAASLIVSLGTLNASTRGMSSRDLLDCPGASRRFLSCRSRTFLNHTGSSDSSGPLANDLLSIIEMTMVATAISGSGNKVDC